MGRKAKEADAGAAVCARALVALGGQAIGAGEFFEAPADVVAAYVAAGEADDRATEADVFGDATVPPRKAWQAPPDEAA